MSVDTFIQMIKVNAIKIMARKIELEKRCGKDNPLYMKKKEKMTKPISPQYSVKRQ